MTEEQTFQEANEEMGKRISASEAVPDEEGKRKLIKAAPPSITWQEKQSIVNAKAAAIEKLDLIQNTLGTKMLKAANELPQTDREGRRQHALELRNANYEISNLRAGIAMAENLAEVRAVMDFE